MAWMNGDFLIEFGENLADLQDKIEILQAECYNMTEGQPPLVEEIDEYFKE